MTAREHLQRLRLRSLERVSANDRTETASCMNGADFFQQLVVVEDRGAARKDDDTATGEATIDDVTNPLSRLTIGICSAS